MPPTPTFAGRRQAIRADGTNLVTAERFTPDSRLLRIVKPNVDGLRLVDWARELDCEWHPGDRLTTRARRPAVATHPQTGEPVWFNHAAFFHSSSLDPATREALLAEVGEGELPNQTFYGDGTDIDPADVEILRQAYRQEAVTFPWRTGDVLLLDNMLTAHAREPFSGPRQILVGMARPHPNG